MTEIVAPFSPPRPEREMLKKHGGTRAAVLHVIWLTLWFNLLNVVIKFTVGFWTFNLTVLADAVHGAIDAANNVVGIVTLKVAYRPPDHNHPYGHRKVEAVASLAIGGMMALTSWEILKTNFTHAWAMWSGEPHATARYSLAGLLLIGVSVGINLFVTLYEHKRGKALKSQFLIADALHTRSDLFVTAMSLASLLLASRFPVWDMVLSLIIVALILRSGWRVIHENLLLLTDAAQLDPVPIRDVVEGIAGVQNCHAIRTHGMPDEVHMDLHIVVPARISASDAHDIEARVREALLNAYPEVVEVAIHHQVQQPFTGQPIRRNEAEI